VLVASIIPAGFALLVLVVAPAFYEPLFDSRTAILGLPPVVGFVILLAGLAAINLVAMRVVRSETAVSVLAAVTTTIGLFVVLLAPAAVSIAVP
jgi:hypothetical protein